MGSDDGGGRELTAEELGAALAWVTTRLLGDPQIEEFVIRPLREAGCDRDRGEVLREIVYLVYFGNHIAIAGHTRDPERAGALIASCADAAIPTLGELEAWPTDAPAPLSEEYLRREGEFLDAMVATEPQEGIAAGCRAAARVAGRHLFGATEFDDECISPLARLLQDQIAICARLLESARIEG